jgi:hypothetical protein
MDLSTTRERREGFEEDDEDLLVEEDEEEETKSRELDILIRDKKRRYTLLPGNLT